MLIKIYGPRTEIGGHLREQFAYGTIRGGKDIETDGETGFSRYTVDACGADFVPTEPVLAYVQQRDTVVRIGNLHWQERICVQYTRSEKTSKYPSQIRAEQKRLQKKSTHETTYSGFRAVAR